MKKIIALCVFLASCGPVVEDSQKKDSENRILISVKNLRELETRAEGLDSLKAVHPPLAEGLERRFAEVKPQPAEGLDSLKAVHPPLAEGLERRFAEVKPHPAEGPESLKAIHPPLAEGLEQRFAEVKPHPAEGPESLKAVHPPLAEGLEQRFAKAEQANIPAPLSEKESLISEDFHRSVSLTLKSAREDFSSCASQARQAEFIRLEWIIGLEGYPMEISVTKNQTGNKIWESCIIAVLKSLNFSEKWENFKTSVHITFFPQGSLSV